MLELIRVSDEDCRAIGSLDSLLATARRYNVPMIIRNYYTKEVVVDHAEK